MQSVTVTQPGDLRGRERPGHGRRRPRPSSTPTAEPIWTKDADGFINYTAYDPATGAVVKTITDVDTTAPASSKPAGGLEHARRAAA